MPEHALRPPVLYPSLVMLIPLLSFLLWLALATWRGPKLSLKLRLGALGAFLNGLATLVAWALSATGVWAAVPLVTLWEIYLSDPEVVLASAISSIITGLLTLVLVLGYLSAGDRLLIDSPRLAGGLLALRGALSITLGSTLLYALFCLQQDMLLPFAMAARAIYPMALAYLMVMIAAWIGSAYALMEIGSRADSRLAYAASALTFSTLVLGLPLLLAGLSPVLCLAVPGITDIMVGAVFVRLSRGAG